MSGLVGTFNYVDPATQHCNGEATLHTRKGIKVKGVDTQHFRYAIFGTLQTVLSMTSYQYFVRMMTAAADKDATATTTPLGPAHGEPGYTRGMLALALDVD